jgi:hypothetical protein
MRKCLLLLFLGLATNSGQDPAFLRKSHPNTHSETGKEVCSATAKVIKVPQEFLTIEDALYRNQVPSADRNASPAPIPGLRIEVAYKDGGYLFKGGLVIDRQCTDIIGIADGDKKPIVRRDEFGKHEQAVIQISASNVRLKGFEITGNYATSPESLPSAVLVLIRKNEKHLAYANIFIEDNDIHSLGHRYPAASRCWTGGIRNLEPQGDYICGSAYGIEIRSDARQITGIMIRGNKVHHLHLGKSEAVTIQNNVSNFSIVENEIYDVDNIAIDIIQHKPFGPTKGQVLLNRVYKSTAKDNPGQLKAYPSIAGIYVDGGSGLDLNGSAILIEKNVVYDYGFGIQVGTETSGEKVQNVIVRNNLIIRNWIVGIGVGKNDQRQKSYVENCVVSNNTLYQNNSRNEGTDSGELRLVKHNKTEQPLKNIYYVNNLIATSGTGRCLLYAKVPTQSKNYNLAFTNNLFVGNSSKFWDCDERMDFQQFNLIAWINLQNNQFTSDTPFEKELPADPDLIILAIRNGTIQGFFNPKAFAVGRGIDWGNSLSQD